MSLKVDGKIVNGSAETLGGLVQLLLALPECQERVIQSIVIDGVEVNDWDDSSSMPIAATSDVVVTTRPLAHALLETAASCREYLPRLIEGSMKIATQLQQGQPKEALGSIPDLIDGLQWYSEFLAYVASLAPEEKEPAQERVFSLNGILEQLVASLEGSDLTLLADLLEYELVPELESGHGYVELLIMNLSAKMGNGR